MIPTPLAPCVSLLQLRNLCCADVPGSSHSWIHRKASSIIRGSEVNLNQCINYTQSFTVGRYWISNCKCGLMSGFGRMYCTSSSCGSTSCPSKVSTHVQTATDHFDRPDSDPSHCARFPSALAARAEPPLRVAIPWHHLCEPDLLRKPLADRNRTWSHSKCILPSVFL